MNRSINLSIAIIILSYLMIAVTWVETVRAQSALESIIKSLVYLKATAKGASETEIGVTKETNATGFVVSDDGLILTVYHFISKLGDVVPETVEIEARIGDKNAKVRRAMIVDGMINTDLLLLKIPPNTKKYAKVTLGSAKSHNDLEPVYTSGFPKSISTSRRQESHIQAREGPGGYLWTTGLKFEQGESGSPIYNAVGKVIGVVKGDEGTLSYMVPIEFADSLLAQVRFAEIKKALQDFESLRHSINWTGYLKKVPGGKKIIITYKKMIAGKPHVKEIDLQVKPMGEINNRKMPLINKNLNYQKLRRTGMTSKIEGVFEIPNLWEDVEAIKKAISVDEVHYLKAYITATLTDGTSLPSTRTKIPYDRED